MSRFNISLNIGLVTSTGKPLRECEIGGEYSNSAQHFGTVGVSIKWSNSGLCLGAIRK